MNVAAEGGVQASLQARYRGASRLGCTYADGSSDCRGSALSASTLRRKKCARTDASIHLLGDSEISKRAIVFKCDGLPERRIL